MCQDRPPTVKGRELVQAPLENSSLVREYPSTSSRWCPVTVPATMAERVAVVHGGAGRGGMAAGVNGLDPS